MSYTEIAGTAKATASQMIAYIKSKNSAVAQSVLDMIPYYISEGKIEGIRGDIAFAQSCLETGNFAFKDTAVTLDQNNFCGMGVTSNGVKGNSFSTPQLGIRAQIQHLKAYANKEALINTCIDPRFKYVTRGCAQYVEWLGIQENPSGKGWASGANYGTKILTILSNILAVVDTSATTTAELYRVRKSWEDSKSQLGAYAILDNAKKMADSNPGYYVYDSNGNQVYPTVSVAYDGLYRVRSAWEDASSQKGAYSILDNAKACCDKYPGTMVFTDVGIAVYPLPYYVTLTKDTSYYANDCKTVLGTAKATKYTIVEIDATCTYGKLKSGAGWLPLAGLTVSCITSPGDKVVAAGKALAAYMLAHNYRYRKKKSAGFSVNETVSNSFRKSVSAKNPVCSCTAGASWAFQIAGYLEEGYVIGHKLENQSHLIDCTILHPNKTGKKLIAEKYLMPGDFVVSSADTCDGNAACIFAGYDNPKKYWMEWGGPFKGRNCKGGSGEDRNDYINIGPIEIPYDESHTIQHVIRPTGNGNGGIDISSIIK